jgi:hypothetical protein
MALFLAHHIQYPVCEAMEGNNMLLEQPAYKDKL